MNQNNKHSASSESKARSQLRVDTASFAEDRERSKRSRGVTVAVEFTKETKQLCLALQNINTNIEHLLIEAEKLKQLAAGIDGLIQLGKKHRIAGVGSDEILQEVLLSSPIIYEKGTS